MADIKISALPGASTLDGTETIPLVQGGTTKKVTSDQFLIKDASGNVGVGTASPNSKLDVRGLIEAGNGTIRSGLTYSTQALVGSLSNHNLGFITNGATQATLDTSGNLGLGVTPKTWGSYFKAIQVGDYAVFANNVQNATAIVASNAYNDDNTNWRYLYTAAASRYDAGQGAHKWYTAPSGTAGNPISFTQAMTLDANGTFLLESPTAAMFVRPSATTNNALARFVNTGGTGYVGLDSSTGGLGVPYALNLWHSGAYPIVFGTSDTERARIDASGNLIQTVNTTAATLTTNGTLTFSIVDNSTLRISVRGSDGTTRTATVALS